MIIDVKATKADPAAAKRPHLKYAFEEPRHSRKALLFGVFLTSVVLYIKSFLTEGNSSAHQQASAATPTEEPKAKPDGPPALALVATQDELEEENPQTGLATDQFELFRSGSGDWDPAPTPDPRPQLSWNNPGLDPRGPAPVKPLAEDLSFANPGNDNFQVSSAAGSGSGGGQDGFDFGPGHGGGPGGPGDGVPGDGDTGGGEPDDGAGPGDGDPGDDDDSSVANRAPRLSGSVYLRDVGSCAMTLIAVADLLRNASDPDGDALSVRNLTASSGTVQHTADGWSFAPSAPGPVTLSYEVTDGQHSVAQTATFNVVAALALSGTAAADVIVGTDCADAINGCGGDDNIDARGGADTVFGGGGNDHIMGGDGNDTLLGGNGNDVIFGGRGNDEISGGKGRDRLFGDEGNDTIFGDVGDDQLYGGSGNDLMFGGKGHDEMYGDAGNDILSGGSGHDRMDGGSGRDHLMGEQGSDILSGGENDDVLSGGADRDTVYGDGGDDIIVGDIDGADDRYDGGEGHDTIDYSAALAAVNVDLASGQATGWEIGQDTLCSIEKVEGGHAGDSIVGSDASEALHGNGGDDVIKAGGGDDTILGGDGCDIIHDGSGSDIVDGGAGDDTVVAALDGVNDSYDGGSGDDELDYSAASTDLDIDLVVGQVSGSQTGDDQVANFERIRGGSGDDHFRAGATGNTFTGGHGNDVFEFAVPIDARSVMHSILDFEVGDRVRMSRYDMFDEVMDGLEDHFEDVYGKKIDDDDLPIRIRHEWTDEMRKTIIEADFDGDDNYELTISISGDHHFSFIELT